MSDTEVLFFFLVFQCFFFSFLLVPFSLRLLIELVQLSDLLLFL